MLPTRSSAPTGLAPPKSPWRTVSPMAQAGAEVRTSSSVQSAPSAAAQLRTAK